MLDGRLTGEIGGAVFAAERGVAVRVRDGLLALPIPARPIPGTAGAPW